MHPKNGASSAQTEKTENTFQTKYPKHGKITYHHHLGSPDDNQLDGHDGQLKTMEDDTGAEAH